jgi:hypothetical protein
MMADRATWEKDVAMIDVRGGIEFVQSLPTFPKGIITFLVVLVAGLILYFLWQEPSEIPQEKQAPGTTNQSGNAASSGQSGGVTAGLYINQAPPVTAQQKEEALSSLQSEIDELAEFPNRPDISEPRTLLEQHAAQTNCRIVYS